MECPEIITEKCWKMSNLAELYNGHSCTVSNLLQNCKFLFFLGAGEFVQLARASIGVVLKEFHGRQEKPQQHNSMVVP